MSQIKYQFSFFFKDIYSVKFSTQDLYLLYKLYSRFAKYDLTFLQFYTYFYFFKFFFTKLNKHLLFLFIFFFYRTLFLYKLGYIHSSVNFFSNRLHNTLFKNFKKVRFNKQAHSWSYLGKFYRPSLDPEYFKPRGFIHIFLKNFKKKFEIYNKLFLFRKKLFIKTPFLLNTPKLGVSSLVKQINIEQIQFFEFQYLRKNKVYNKGRYSRCRQNYRTGVYMCMYLSVVSIFGLYYWFFKFSFNFTYLWWLFIMFCGSFFLPKIIKYRLYEPLTILNKLFGFFKWLLLVLRSIFF